MIPTFKKVEIERALSKAFSSRYKRKDVAITGILLARPENKVTQEQILPNLDHWHWRSGDYTQFFCVGYLPYEPYAEAKSVVTVAGSKWYFSAEAFNEVLEDVEKQTKWRYRSGCFIVLANARFDSSTQHAAIDYRRGMVVDIGKLLKSGAFESADELAELLFDFASKLTASDIVDPVWEFSDKAGIQVFRKSLVESLLDSLPARLKILFTRGEQLVVQEL